MIYYYIIIDLRINKQQYFLTDIKVKQLKVCNFENGKINTFFGTLLKKNN